MSINVFRHRGTTAVFHKAAQAMFPHLDVVIAYRLLFGSYSGIVQDGIADLEGGDIDWAGDPTVLLPTSNGAQPPRAPHCRIQRCGCWSSGWRTRYCCAASHHGTSKPRCGWG